MQTDKKMGGRETEGASDPWYGESKKTKNVTEKFRQLLYNNDYSHMTRQECICKVFISIKIFTKTFKHLLLQLNIVLKP